MIRKNYLNYFNEDGTVKNEMKENLICEIHAKIGRAWNVGKCKIRRCFVDNKCLIPDIAYEKRKGNDGNDNDEESEDEQPLDGIYKGIGIRQLEYLRIVKKNYLDDFREDGQLKDGLKIEMINKLRSCVGDTWNVNKSKIWSRFVNNNVLWPIIAHEKRKAIAREIIEQAIVEVPVHSSCLLSDEQIAEQMAIINPVNQTSSEFNTSTYTFAEPPDNNVIYQIMLPSLSGQEIGDQAMVEASSNHIIQSPVASSTDTITSFLSGGNMQIGNDDIELPMEQCDDIYCGPSIIDYLVIIKGTFLIMFNDNGTVKDDMKDDLLDNLMELVGRRWQISRSELLAHYVENKKLNHIIANEKANAWRIGNIYDSLSLNGKSEGTDENMEVIESSILDDRLSIPINVQTSNRQKIRSNINLNISDSIDFGESFEFDFKDSQDSNLSSYDGPRVRFVNDEVLNDTIIDGWSDVSMEENDVEKRH
ncbi:unnamed protein product [Chironomus riparius]|uniref:Uncharacterized protein n=1 Tax=Chironomus riparius TaxID=315576 RepID=A0A9N9RWG9_9DIPT|nr:unnamed protein product [Chironomus riparius]